MVVVMGIKDINFIEIKNCIIDEIHVRENTSNIDLTSEKKEWQFDTYMLAKFLGNLEAGNITLGGLDITHWRIRKRRIDVSSIMELATIPAGIGGDFQYLDTGIRPNVIYEYIISPMSEDIEGQPHTIQIEVSFDYWWISDDEESYPLFANLEVSDIIINKQRHQYDGFDRYPTVSYGNQKYKSGTITAVLVDAFLNVTRAYREKFEDFINNGNPKYLRNPDGDMWKVDTFNSGTSYFTKIAEPLTTVRFDFVEVEDISDE